MLLHRLPQLLYVEKDAVIVILLGTTRGLKWKYYPLRRPLGRVLFCDMIRRPRLQQQMIPRGVLRDA